MSKGQQQQQQEPQQQQEQVPEPQQPLTLNQIKHVPNQHQHQRSGYCEICEQHFNVRTSSISCLRSAPSCNFLYFSSSGPGRAHRFPRPFSRGEHPVLLGQVGHGHRAGQHEQRRLRLRAQRGGNQHDDSGLKGATVFLLHLTVCPPVLFRQRIYGRRVDRKELMPYIEV